MIAAMASRGSSVLSFARQQPLGAISLLLILIMFFAGVFAERVAPYHPEVIDFTSILQGPSSAHWAGTDAFGRDILTRIIYGARTALLISLVSSLLGCTLGAILGASSAYFGGRIDYAIQRVVDILLSFPLIVLALVVVAIMGRTLVFGIDIGLIAAITIPIIPQVARVIRSSALSIRRMSYVEAARVAGYSNTRVIFRHMAPNLVAPYLVLLSVYMSQAILLEASLSFLGLGVSEPTPAWGLMLAGSATEFFAQAPWMVVFPGLAISLAVFAFNLLGDSLRDWLDPRFRT